MAAPQQVPCPRVYSCSPSPNAPVAHEILTAVGRRDSSRGDGCPKSRLDVRPGGSRRREATARIATLVNDAPPPGRAKTDDCDLRPVLEIVELFVLVFF